MGDFPPLFLLARKQMMKSFLIKIFGKHDDMVPGNDWATITEMIVYSIITILIIAVLMIVCKKFRKTK